jgi:hypothetical protein
MGKICISNSGYVEVADDGSFGLCSNMHNYASLGWSGTAREYAHAILRLLGDEVPGEKPKTNRRQTYITTNGQPSLWDGKRIINGWTDVFTDDADAVSVISHADVSDDEYHIFRLVATVGPQPQPLPERAIKRYE